MMLAGHETSAHTLTWIFGLLAKHPEIQEKLYQEIQSSTSVESIPYLKLVMNEAMRLYPAFPVLSRKTAVDCQLGDYKIPQNTNVVIPIYVMQRHADNWDRPTEFIPERFADPAAEKSYAFLPFSRGPRRCIAELFAMTEMSIIVVNLLKLYKIELTTNTLPEEVAFVSLKPVDGMNIKLTKR
jgi:cytochrome P450